jgi:hypothetical protein
MWDPKKINSENFFAPRQLYQSKKVKKGTQVVLQNIAEGLKVKKSNIDMHQCKNV